MTNQDIVRSFFEQGINGGRPEIGEQLFHPEFLDHHPIPGQPAGSAAGRFIVEHMMQISNGKPNVKIEHIFGDGEMVAVRWTTISGLEVLLHVRVRDGKIAERWASFNRPNSKGGERWAPPSGSAQG